MKGDVAEADLQYPLCLQASWFSNRMRSRECREIEESRGIWRGPRSESDKLEFVRLTSGFLNHRGPDKLEFHALLIQ